MSYNINLNDEEEELLKTIWEKDKKKFPTIRPRQTLIRILTYEYNSIKLKRLNEIKEVKK